MRTIIAAGAALLLLSGCQSQSSGRAMTVDWLQTQGMDSAAANSLADNKPALRKYLADRSMQSEDDRYCRSLGAVKGSSAYIQCRTSVSANRPVNTPPPKPRELSCTSNMVLGSLKTTCR